MKKKQEWTVLTKFEKDLLDFGEGKWFAVVFWVLVGVAIGAGVMLAVAAVVR